MHDLKSLGNDAFVQLGADLGKTLMSLGAFLSNPDEQEKKPHDPIPDSERPKAIEAMTEMDAWIAEAQKRSDLIKQYRPLHSTLRQLRSSMDELVPQQPA